MAVDGTGVYWANNASGTVGRADLDGSNANQSFIVGANAPIGVAVDGAHVYWTSFPKGSVGTGIGRANLDGSNANQSFITGVDGAFGVAVDALSAPPPSAPVPAEFRVGEVKRNKERGSAKLTVRVSLPGTLRLAQTGSVKSTRTEPSPEGEAKLRIKARGKAKKKLNETGEAKVKAKVTYLPDCAPSDTKRKKIKLVKR